jgi:hypothetical protein
MNKLIFIYLLSLDIFILNVPLVRNYQVILFLKKKLKDWYILLSKINKYEKAKLSLLKIIHIKNIILERYLVAIFMKKMMILITN